MRGDTASVLDLVLVTRKQNAVPLPAPQTDVLPQAVFASWPDFLLPEVECLNLFLHESERKF